MANVNRLTLALFRFKIKHKAAVRKAIDEGQLSVLMCVF